MPYEDKKRASDLKVPFGLNPLDNRLYEPGQVESGKACGCVCPECRQPLQARHSPSGKRAENFAHDPGTACASGFESAVHLAAKQLIQDHQQLWCPLLIAKFNKHDALENRHDFEKRLCPAGLLGLEDVRLEKWLDDDRFRPDIVTVAPYHGELLIEVAFTNKVKDEKLRKIQSRNVATLEIDVSCIVGINFEALEKLLFEESGQTMWLHHPQLEIQRAEFLRSIEPDIAEAQRKAEENKKIQEEERIRQEVAEKVRWQATEEERVRYEAEVKIRWQAMEEERKRIAKANAAFRDLPTLDKVVKVEQQLGLPRKRWPKLFLVQAKPPDAIKEHRELWQAAVFTKFLKQKQPGRDEFRLNTVVEWVQERFNCSDPIGVVRAIKYYLAILANRGFLKKDGYGGYSVVANDPLKPDEYSGPKASLRKNSDSIPMRYDAKEPVKEDLERPHAESPSRALIWRASLSEKNLLDARATVPLFCKDKEFSPEMVLRLLDAIKARSDLAETSPGELAVAWVKTLGGSEQLWAGFFRVSGLAL